MNGAYYNSTLGLWFPSSARNPQKCFDGIQKYIGDMDFLLKLIPKKRREGSSCVQAGGHIGLWPLKLAFYFGSVYTFEADPLVYEALALNVDHATKYKNLTNIWPSNRALGKAVGKALFRYSSTGLGNAAMAEVRDTGLETTVNVVSIDSFALQQVAAIVLDVEGYEPWILEGAKETIARDHPVLMCEVPRLQPGTLDAQLMELDYVPVTNTINVKCRDRFFIHRKS